MAKVPALSIAAQALRKGIYEHYKGGRYRLIGVAHHTESQQELVIYQALYGHREIWARPIVVFTEVVQHNDSLLPRFRYIG